MSRLTRWAASAAATAVVLAPALSGGAAHAAASSYPSGDPFYRYDTTGATPTPYVPDAGTTPGQVLDTRDHVTLPVMADLLKALAYSHGAALDSFSIDATQLLYRTQDELGHPSATVTTVLRPEDLPKPVTSRGVVAYLSYYDGLSDTCDPSYTLQNGKLDGEKAAISQLLESGYTVTIPDFEGEGLDWAAGHEAGWSTLDALRATEKSLSLPTSTKVATVGYSGGSIAGEWVAELQPTYAPELNLVGTAIGGVPANLRHLVNYVNSDADADRDSWFGVIPAATVSLGRATDQDFSSLLSAYGDQVATDVSTKCIGDFANKYSGKHLSDLVNTGVDFMADSRVAAILDRLTMGKGATPTAPMFMMNGRSSDGIGDGVMVADDVKALAANYCSRNVAVQYDEQSGLHGAVGQTFMVKAIGLVPGGGFIDKWFNGTDTPADYNCAPRVIGDPAPPLPKVTIRALSRGHHDIVIVTAPRGATVKIFVAGHKKVVARAVAKKGHARLSIADHNGKRVTHYRVLVGGTTYRVAMR
ncbi:lipase family protein [Nocardioides nematodiphilus]|uniref:lipase family protein n=1 Tax=Nocardioides nematodiphilus TaxID=2849669 RepID=UPI001CDA4BA3|nr:lipase family protein [Nocardioides nematodiphilus]MCA1982459.1 lipase family protein [Nocardioides nematodiphilus]